MSRIKSVIGLGSKALAVAIVVGLALGSESVSRLVDGAFFASWRALGDRLATRELDAIAWQLDRERQETERIGSLRDELSARLQSLGVRRECAAARLGNGHRARETSPERELAHLDAAIGLLRSAVARADRVLDNARRDLREHEGELTALQAAADTSRMERELIGAVGEPSLWYVRVDRARDLLPAAVRDREEQDARLRPSLLP